MSGMKQLVFLGAQVPYGHDSFDFSRIQTSQTHKLITITYMFFIINLTVITIIDTGVLCLLFIKCEYSTCHTDVTNAFIQVMQCDISPTTFLEPVLGTVGFCLLSVDVSRACVFSCLPYDLVSDLVPGF